ncbi:Ca(2+)/calmodulin-dependent protein kinase phosphatase [Entamoeba marina]
MSISVHCTTPSNPELPSKPRTAHRRARSSGKGSKGTFYGQERPIFVNGKIIMSSNVSPIRGKSGQSFDENKDDVLLQGNTFSCSKRFNIGEAQTIGKRLCMEDVVMIKGDLAEDLDVFGVFDGHHGKDAAVLASKNILSFLNLNELLSDNYQSHIIDLFQKMHENIIEKNRIRNNCINCFYSPCHNTNNNDEIEEVKKRGGDVVDVNGVLRVNSQIQVTRSLGDASLHPPLITTPDISCFSLDDIDSLIICSDGIDVLDADTIVGLATQPISPEGQAQYLRNYAFEKDSKDNITSIVFTARPEKLLPSSF